MNKAFKQLLAAGAALVLVSTSINAQNEIATYKRNTTTIQISTSAEVAEPDFTAGRPRLAQSFSKHFPAASNISWSKMNTGNQACFLNAGKKSRAVFTENDELSYSIAELTAKDLPVTISRLIQNIYQGYSVFSAQEVKAGHRSCYHLVLENASGYVNMKISGEEIEEMSRTARSK